MNKKLQILPLFLLLFSLSHTQTWNWVNKIGSSPSDKAITVKVDTAENVITSGYFSQSINLGNGVNLAPSGSGKEAFVAKYNSQGVAQWAIGGGHYFDDRVLGMDLDEEGNTYFTGTCWNTIELGGIALSNPPNTCCDQCFVYKADAAGNIVWGNMAGGNGDDQGLDLVTDKNGNSYVGGFMNANGTMIFGDTMNVIGVNTGTHVYNYWVGKIDSVGVWKWAATFGNLPWDPVANKYVERDIALRLGDDNDIYVTGGFDGTRTFGDTTLTSVGGTDVFLLRMSTSGVIEWAVSGGSDEDDWANGVATDSVGHVYITGEHRDSMYFGTVLIKNFKKRDIFVAKFDAANGACLWGKRAGSDEGGERGNDIYADRNCNVFVTGEVGPKGKFGSNIMTDSIGNPHLFVARIDPDGQWMWATTGGTIDSADIRSNSITAGRNKNLYICGNFRGYSVFGDSSLTSAGKTDGFVACLTDLAPYNDCDDFIPVPFVNAQILSIGAPVDSICGNKVYPEFLLTNIGNLTMTSATIEYTIDGGIPVVYTWYGGLDSLETDIVNLPPSPITAGGHLIQIKITLANGGNDTDTTNNVLSGNFYIISIPTIPLPYLEGFETGTFPPNGMTLYNPDSGITWETTSAAAFLGANSCVIRNIANNVIGSKDELRLPALDFNIFSNPQLNFDLAYASFTQGASDTLEIMISTDCGETYQVIDKLYGSSLVTAPATTSAFVPNISQWKHKVYSLSNYGNVPAAKIVFRNISGYENNLYLDNINIYGYPVDIENAHTNEPEVTLYPNPTSQFLNIRYISSLTSAPVKIELYDITGRLLNTWNKNSVTGSNQWEVNLNPIAKGLYFMRFTEGNISTQRRFSVK